MKRFTLLFLMLAGGLMVFAEEYLSVSQAAAAGKIPEFVIYNGNRSTPAGIVLYSQPYTVLPFDGYPSSANDNYEIADDFILVANYSVDIVRWWFFMVNPPASTGWNIRIYNNASCLPSTLVTSWVIPAGAVNYEYVTTHFGAPIYDCWTTLAPSFNAIGGQHYWISIQPTGYNYWCCNGTWGSYTNCVAAHNYYGFFSPFGPLDFSFELYSNGISANVIPISNWAIGLGIFLILVATVLRYRRVI